MTDGYVIPVFAYVKRSAVHILGNYNSFFTPLRWPTPLAQMSAFFNSPDLSSSSIIYSPRCFNFEDNAF